MNTKKFYGILTIVLIAFVFALTVFIISSEPLPLGSDTYYHLKLATMYVHGNFTGAIQTSLNYIQFFYPPIYQIAMDGPAALSPNPYLTLQIIECLFLPLTFLATSWLVWKYAGAKAALFTGFALLASWSFIDGALQARPESLDLLLFSIIVYAVLEAKKKTAGLLATIITWSHGLAAISSLTGIFLYKLKDKAWRKTLILVILAISPIIALSIIYFGGAIHTWLLGQTSTSNPQQYMFWNNPFPWIIYYAGLSLLGIPFLLRKHKTQIETLMTYAFVGNTFMLIFWADRWLQYSAIPWAILFGCGISKLHGWKLYVMLTISIIWTTLYISIYILTSTSHLWWQPGD